jgi:hypothetical protein
MAGVAAGINSDRFTVHVPPAANVPSVPRPVPGRTVALVVKVEVVPAPVVVRGKNVNAQVPAVGAWPPLAIPNGSAVVLAKAIPVSNGPVLLPYGSKNVVFAATILMILRGPRSSWAKRGYPPVDVGKFSVGVFTVSSASPIGISVAVTEIAPGDSETLLPSWPPGNAGSETRQSMVSVLVKLLPVTVRLLVLLVDVIEVLLGPAPRRSEAAVLLPEPVHPNVRVRFAGTLLKVNRMFVPFVTATPLEEL